MKRTGKSRPVRKSKRSEPAIATAVAAPMPTCPLVVVGGSAARLDSVRRLLRHLPVNSGAAFIVALHMDGNNNDEKVRADLSRSSRLPVRMAADGAPIQPNRIYVVPGQSQADFVDSRLALGPMPHGTRGIAIDRLLHAAAQSCSTPPIAILLAGTAADGMGGLHAIKAAGGITLAEPADGALDNGDAMGGVDAFRDPESIGQEIARLVEHPGMDGVGRIKVSPSDVPSELFDALRRYRDVDFTKYNVSTIARRMYRRMVLHRLASPADYVRYVESHPDEVDGLYADLLINVTRFFRDPEMFESLRRHVTPMLARRRAAGDMIRAWVPGCATGEEVYSLAICLLDALGQKEPVRLQIFGTDISDAAVERARTATYAESVAADIPPEFLGRYFHKTSAGYQVTKMVRECCIFARHNVMQDPPFPRLDLVSCRNVLIYLNTSVQRQVIPILHYALNNNGFLVLGKSETVGPFSNLFAVVDKTNRIFSKRFAPGNVALPVRAQQLEEAAKGRPGGRVERETASAVELQQELDRLLLTRYAPAAVLVNDELEILQFRGRTSPFLEPLPGRATLNLLKMVREGLLVGLQAAIHRARKENVPVRRSGLHLGTDGSATEVSIEATPVQLPAVRERHFLITFQTIAPPTAVPRGRERGGQALRVLRQKDREITQLRAELAGTREAMQSIIEEQEATNEELTAANEELQSSNEELQSTNEELETAKEEVQAANEEMSTVNEELNNRNAELAQAYNDLTNLLASVDIPILILGRDLRIRSYTPKAEKVLNVIPGDVGRPLRHLNLPIAEDLEKLVRQVLETLHPSEDEVQDKEGRWHLMRIQPYETSDNHVEGAIVALVDIDARKRAEQTAREQYRQLFESSIHPMLVFGLDSLEFRTANDAALRMFHINREQLPKMTPRDLFAEHGLSVVNRAISHFRSNPATMDLKSDAVPSLRRADGELFSAEVTWTPLTVAGERMVLMIVTEHTSRRRSESDFRDLVRVLLRTQDEERRRIARELHDSTSQLLAGLTLNLSVVADADVVKDRRLRQNLVEAVKLAHKCSREINTMAYLLHPPLLDEAGLIPAVRVFLEGFGRRTRIDVALEIEGEMKPLPRHVELAVFRIIQEALNNIYKHTTSGTAVILLKRDSSQLQIEVGERGGKRAGPKNTLMTAEAGAGIGLASMRERVRELNGTFKIITSKDGYHVLVTVPLEES